MTTFANKAKELRASKQVKESLNREKAADQIQQQRTQEFFTLRARLKTAENFTLALGELKGIIADLRKKAAAKEESGGAGHNSDHAAKCAAPRRSRPPIA